MGEVCESLHVFILTKILLFS